MTTREGAIVGAYTGFLCGSMEALHAYAAEKMGRPVWTHEFADAAFINELRDKSRPDFVSIATQQTEVPA